LTGLCAACLIGLRGTSVFIGSSKPRGSMSGNKIGVTCTAGRKLLAGRKLQHMWGNAARSPVRSRAVKKNHGEGGYGHDGHDAPADRSDEKCFVPMVGGRSNEEHASPRRLGIPAVMNAGRRARSVEKEQPASGVTMRRMVPFVVCLLLCSNDTLGDDHLPRSLSNYTRDPCLCKPPVCPGSHDLCLRNTHHLHGLEEILLHV
jgi:hypothetical protein